MVFIHNHNVCFGNLPAGAVYGRVWRGRQGGLERREGGGDSNGAAVVRSSSSRSSSSSSSSSLSISSSDIGSVAVIVTLLRLGASSRTERKAAPAPKCRSRPICHRRQTPPRSRRGHVSTQCPHLLVVVLVLVL